MTGLLRCTILLSSVYFAIYNKLKKAEYDMEAVVAIVEPSQKLLDIPTPTGLEIGMNGSLLVAMFLFCVVEQSHGNQENSGYI